MNIFAKTVVTITFKLFDADNALVEETHEPIAYLHGGHSGIFPKVEAAIDDKKAGDKVSVTLEPVDAFGEYDAALIRIEPVASLPPDLTTGGYLVAEKDGEEIVFRVTSIADGKAVLDGNHELAGQRLRFDATIVDGRVLMEDRRVLVLDERALLSEIAERAERITARWTPRRPARG